MRIFTASVMIAALAVMLPAPPAGAWDRTYAIRIEHLRTDVTTIPAGWIDTTRANSRMYYGHTSHGEQITGGLTNLEADSALYAFEMEHQVLPAADSAICVNDDAAVLPNDFFETAAGMNRTRAVLDAWPAINIAMFMWCMHLDDWTSEQVRAYLDSMEVLETEYPDVVFIYATGHAQTAGAQGWNRHQRNEEIRAWCDANNKVLFDFADMDVWWYNPATWEWETNSYDYEGNDVPLEHPQYSGNQHGHTTWESCENKGAAMWHLTAMLAGWDGRLTATEEKSLGGIKMLYRER
jgi:hypothetical protein